MFNSKKNKKLIDLYNKEDKELEKDDNREKQDSKEEIVQQVLLTKEKKKQKSKEVEPLLERSISI